MDYVFHFGDIWGARAGLAAHADRWLRRSDPQHALAGADFLLCFGLPGLGLRLDANEGALIALILNGTTYTIESVGRGQIEAAGALGLTTFRMFRLIVLPQALRVVVPPLGERPFSV